MPFDLNAVFRHPPSTPDQLVQYEAIREAAIVFAEVIVAETPASADQTVAIRKVREAVMTANASIDLDGKF